VNVKKVSIELIIVIIIIEVLQIISIWSIDVAVGGMLRGPDLNNGFGSFEASKIYHISMYMMIIIDNFSWTDNIYFIKVVALMLLFLRNIFNNDIN
jgi:hypothetical protein